jgi:hypothetical protein
VGRLGLDACDFGRGPVVSCYNEPFGSIKCGEFLD